MKRKATDEGLKASSKKSLTEWPQDGDLKAETASVISAADNSSHSNVSTALHPTQTAPATSISALSRASRRFPSDLKTIKCTYSGCTKTFNRPARLAAHLRSHSNDRPFHCDYPGCNKDYLEEKHLTQHIKGSHTHEKKYPCPEPDCGKSFVTATRLRRHAAVHEGAERFRCRGYDSCTMSFRKHQTLQRHIRVTHLEQAAYICGNDSCDSGFETAGALRRHVERQHGVLKFWCDECGNVSDEDEEPRRVGFTTMLLLQAHMRREHINCMFCDAKCGSQADLERHIDLHHSGTTVEDRKTVTCSWDGCGKSFTRVSNLNTHIKTAHEGVRFVCGKVNTYETEDISDWNWAEEGCGQTFVSKLKLEEHVRFVHLGRQRPPKLYDVASALTNLVADEVTAIAPRPNVMCTMAGCSVLFLRQVDLDNHLQNDHCNDSVNYNGAIDPQLQQLQQFPPFPDEPSIVTAGAEESFWFAAGMPDAAEPSSFETEWAEMRRLIDIDSLAGGQQQEPV